MEQAILALFSDHPVFMTVLSVVGALRLLNKPLFSLLHAVVEVTPTKSDNELLAKVEASKAYKWFVYLLDWFASVKVPQVTEKKEEPKQS